MKKETFFRYAINTWLSLILVPIIENKMADKAEKDAICI